MDRFCNILTMINGAQLFFRWTTFLRDWALNVCNTQKSKPNFNWLEFPYQNFNDKVQLEDLQKEFD